MTESFNKKWNFSDRFIGFSSSIKELACAEANELLGLITNFPFVHNIESIKPLLTFNSRSLPLLSFLLMQFSSHWEFPRRRIAGRLSMEKKKSTRPATRPLISKWKFHASLREMSMRVFLSRPPCSRSGAESTTRIALSEWRGCRIYIFIYFYSESLNDVITATKMFLLLAPPSSHFPF